MATELVFLFGAGASKAANEHVHPCSPPLMDKLYERLAKHFPQEWGYHVQIGGYRLGDYREEFKENFEKTFAKIFLRVHEDDESPRTTPDTLTILEQQRTLALYFSQFVLDSSRQDPYSKLLASLIKSRKIQVSQFGSLNYDCLFEQAAHGLGVRVDYFGGSRDAGLILAAKIHGSCNFITQEISQMNRALLAIPGLRYEIQVKVIPPNEVECKLAEKISGPEANHLPVMSQIAAEKWDLLAPVKMHQVRNKWSEGVRSAKSVAVIGVSHNPNDTHVLQPIAETVAAELLYIGDNKNFVKWHATNSCFEHIGEKFEEELKHLLRRLKMCS